MNRIRIMTKYIYEVKCNVRLKLVSVVTTVRQNYVCKVKGTMTYIDCHISSTKMWINTNVDVSREKNFEQ